VSADGLTKTEMPRRDVSSENGDEDAKEKITCAKIFEKVLERVKGDEEYKRLEAEHRAKYDHLEIPRMEGDEVDVKEKQIEEKPKKVTLAAMRRGEKEERERKKVKEEEEENEEEDEDMKSDEEDSDGDGSDAEKKVVKKEEQDSDNDGMKVKSEKKKEPKKVHKMATRQRTSVKKQIKDEDSDST